MEIDHTTAIRRAFDRALAAIDPESLTHTHLISMDIDQTVDVIALGKAAAGMARGATAALGSLLGSALAIVPPGTDPVSGFTMVDGAHPDPDERSLHAGRAALDLAAGSDDLLVLVSGGGSAMCEVPVDGVTIDDIGDLVNRLMRAGAPIQDLNAVRRHLSQIKNGGLAATARGRVRTLIISDVPGDDPATVASGPTVPDGSNPADALEVLRRHQIEPPQAIADALTSTTPSRAGEEATVIGTRHLAAEAAVASLLADGIDTIYDPDHLDGPSDAAVSRMLSHPRTMALVMTGETTVTVHGDGLGGRNQHAALVAATLIEGSSMVFGTLATDGVDGPTDAGGAIVDGATAGRIRGKGIDPDEAIRACDSHPVLDAADALIRTGPTGTNVADLWVVVGLRSVEEDRTGSEHDRSGPGAVDDGRSNAAS